MYKILLFLVFYHLDERWHRIRERRLLKISSVDNSSDDGSKAIKLFTLLPNVRVFNTSIRRDEVFRNVFILYIFNRVHGFRI